MATPRQNWALFCATGCDVRNLNLSLEQASDLLEQSNSNGKDEVVSKLLEMGATQKRKPSGNNDKKKDEEHFETLMKMAHQSGMKAVDEVNVQPMVVVNRSNPLDDNSPITKSYYVASGPCGFATIHFPGNSSFARWAKKKNLCTKSYNGGYYINVTEFGQSYQLKSAYASAFAEILRKGGVDKAYSQSRLD